MDFDLHNKLTVTQILAPIVKTADTNCTGVDGADCDGIEHIVNVGAEGDTLSANVKIDLILQDSDDDSTYADVTDAADYIGDMVDADNGIFATYDADSELPALARIGYKGTKRYSRVVLDFTGTHSTGTPIGVIAIKRRRSVGTTSLLVQ